MKKANKKSLYLLLPAVLLVWGLIVVRTIGVFIEPPVKEFRNDFNQVITTLPIDSNLYVLNLNYPNPFKSQSIVPQNQSKSKSKTSSLKVKKVVFKKSPVIWPKLAYQGQLRRKDQTLCLIDVNDQIHFFSVGQTLQGIKLLKSFTDSVHLEYKRERKYIKK
ncbi:MAG: hypothetical protein NXI09_15705 [Bacteroidetes bacterium]|nr:hypothetical protein [Bacteroidota bacterium]